MLRHKELKREENYVATENGRAIRQVKASWSRQMFFFFVLRQTVQPMTKIKEGNMSQHFQSMS